jgi:hypothetical protein
MAKAIETIMAANNGNVINGMARIAYKHRNNESIEMA